MKFVIKNFYRNSEFHRFLFSGLTNMLFGFSLFSLLSLTNLSTYIILTISSLLGVLFNFYTTSSFAFKKFKIKYLPSFLISYTLILAIFGKCIILLTPVLGHRIYSMALLMIPFALITFLVMKTIVFKD